MIDLSAFDFEVLGNAVSRWIVALLAMVALFAILTALRAVIIRQLAHGADEAGSWQDIARTLATRISVLFVTVLSIFAGVLLLDLPGEVRSTLFSTVSIAVFIQAALIADKFVFLYAGGQSARYGRYTTNFQNAISLIQVLARTAIWSVAALLVLDNLGFDVTALVAGLGIGGIAIALAAQNILGDLFASLAIILDKPFVVGDFIIFDEHVGTVEKIGIKTTRLRSLSGEQLVCANNDLLSTRVRNLQRMSERRSVFTIGVVYETPYEKLARIPALLREIVESENRVRLDRTHFVSYGDFSLNFETAYYVLSPEYNDYMDTQQAINLKIFKRFEEEGIAFAYPTRTVILATPDNGAPGDTTGNTDGGTTAAEAAGGS